MKFANQDQTLSEYTVRQDPFGCLARPLKVYLGCEPGVLVRETSCVAALQATTILLE
jgi:hypothetical protein